MSSPPQKKPRIQTSLLTFLKKAPNVVECPDSSQSRPVPSLPSSHIHSSTACGPVSTASTSGLGTSEPVLSQTSPVPSPPLSPIQSSIPCGALSASGLGKSELHANDIGLALRVTVSKEIKMQLLKQTWRPDPSYNFPAVTQGKRSRHFNYDWFGKRPWLAYTRAHDEGAVCKYCVLFGGEIQATQGGVLAVGAFCIRPFSRYKNAIEMMNKHESTENHRKAEMFAQHFLEMCEKPEADIRNVLSEARLREVEGNRKLIKIPIETIIFLCRQGLPLRGHRDAGKITEPTDRNEGNFRETLRYRIAGGESQLETQLKGARGNATYLSPQTQNEIISACGAIICRDIVKDVSGTFYSVLADDTTDIAGMKQLSLSIRYVCNVENKWMIQEEFIGFAEAIEATGEGLAKLILQQLHSSGLDLSLLRGQGYDGCSTMSGKEKGVQAVISQKWPKALYFHCASHRLNLALVHSAEEPLVRNAMSTIQTCATFLSNSSKRLQIFKRHADMCDEHCLRAPKKLCPTRWIESHKSVIAFKEAIPVTIETLEEVIEGSDRDASANASNMLDSITKPSFFIALVVIEALPHCCYRFQECSSRLNLTCKERTLLYWRLKK